MVQSVLLFFVKLFWHLLNSQLLPTTWLLGLHCAWCFGTEDCLPKAMHRAQPFGTSGKYWGVAAIPKGIAAMPHIAAMLLQHCNCGCVAAVLLQYLVVAILPQWGHCCNTLCALLQSAMPQGIAATLQQ